MTEQTGNRELFFKASGRSIEKIRNYLSAQSPTQEQLSISVEAVNMLKKAADGGDLDSFRSIVSCVEKVLLRHSAAQTIPSKVELEILLLAIDWLAQLTLLYSKNLPEPKSLITELLYAFDLVDHSQDAASLTKLVAEHAEQKSSIANDPFLEDPVFTVKNCSAAAQQDPFADDPGFGLEFDLLQRTLDLSPGARERVSDPFNDDPLVLEALAEIPQPPYDLFDGDPSLSDELDPQK